MPWQMTWNTLSFPHKAAVKQVVQSRIGRRAQTFFSDFSFYIFYVEKNVEKNVEKDVEKKRAEK